jgi:hypothetical protein
VITRDHLITAIEAARVYYLNQQFKEGNFLYAMDLSTGKYYDDDNQVRQAGALWGLSCLNRDRFTENTRRALLAGIDFFDVVEDLRVGNRVRGDAQRGSLGRRPCQRKRQCDSCQFKSGIFHDVFLFSYG